MKSTWAVSMEPATSVDYSNRGLDLLSTGDASTALHYFDQALLLDPMSAPAHFNRAIALGRLGRFADEVVAYDNALTLGLDIGHLHHNRGIALLNQGRFDEALQACIRAVNSGDSSVIPIAWNTHGLVLQELRRHEEARDSFSRAMNCMPDYPVARLNHGISSLMLGDYAAGWAGYEYRWWGAREVHTLGYAPPEIDLPIWHGPSAEAQVKLLVFAEQGLGDTLQFCRFLEPAKALVTSLGLVCPPTLQLLLQRSFPDVQVMSDAPPGGTEWTHQLSLMSLPHRLGTTLEQVAIKVPYLAPDISQTQRWHENLDSQSRKFPRIGLVWAGSALHYRDTRRNLPPNILERLLRDGGVQWVSLQLYQGVSNIYRVASHLDLLDLTNQITDFASTADLISSLDAVVAVDTAVAHLASAIGKPTWLLNRYESEWRWMCGRTDSSWYPSLNVLTQESPGDWDGVLTRLLVELSRFFNLR